MQRLKEFGDESHDINFSDRKERDKAFANILRETVMNNNSNIRKMISCPDRHLLSRLGTDLAEMLTENGFIELRTPLIISNASLEKMSVTEGSPFHGQVFRIDEKRCLRPMLAPNFYLIIKKLRERMDGPIRVFEIGPCFRREPQNGNHLEEFTMLTFAEMGMRTDPKERLRELFSKIMDMVGLRYRTVADRSEVFNETLDVVVNRKEVASGAVGPHVLDKIHDINEPWCGAGFGLERLLSEALKKSSIRKVGGSLAYLNGAKIY